jgi:hypothetical protein
MPRLIVFHCGLLALMFGTLSASPADRVPSSPEKQVQRLKEQLASEMAQNAMLRQRNEELEKELLDISSQLKKLEAQLKIPPMHWTIPQWNMPHLLQNGPTVPPDWNERQFNGVPYYIIPLQEGGRDQAQDGTR